ncbi:MAG: YihY/virulence factor BrkB family protein [Myxococcota bacterium]
MSDPTSRALRAAQRVWRSASSDHLSLVAAGVAFYALLSLFPALGFGVALYGLVADSNDVLRALEVVRGVVPGDAYALLTDQLIRISEGPDTALSVGAVVGLALALWSANRGTKALLSGMNIAYDEAERRGFVELNLVSLALTALIAVSGCLAIGGFTLVHTWVPDTLTKTPVWRSGQGLVLWVVAQGLLGILYRFGPNRRRPAWRWVSVGAVLASVAGVAASLVFSAYVEHFANYNQTFGALGGVAITMTWFWLAAFVVLLGAEIDAEIDRAPATPALREVA